MGLASLSIGKGKCAKVEQVNFPVFVQVESSVVEGVSSRRVVVDGEKAKVE
jgi:hypothetical protein